MSRSRQNWRTSESLIQKSRIFSATHNILKTCKPSHCRTQEAISIFAVSIAGVTTVFTFQRTASNAIWRVTDSVTVYVSERLKCFAEFFANYVCWIMPTGSWCCRVYVNFKCTLAGEALDSTSNLLEETYSLYYLFPLFFTKVRTVLLVLSTINYSIIS